MVKQYPHTIRIETSSDSTRDNNGNWVTGTPSTVEKKGRFETNSGDSFVKTDNGENVVYDGIIYMPLPAIDIAAGAKITALDGDKVLSQGNVKRFSAGQMNMRIWL
jgi:hypothetical protein